jgi:3-oxoacyl-(acyl-carrier-protein) synthase
MFETEEFADAPKAELLGAYSASEDSTDVMGQREDGQGFVKAIRGALSIADLPHYIEYIVKTHGTGTASNNTSESNALYEVFKDRFIATSYKARIGHTMGASGLLETCLLLDSLRFQDKVPCILNRTEKDKQYLSEDVSPSSSYIVSLAAGMGNIYSAAVFDWGM